MKILGHQRLKPRTESVELGEAEDGTAVVVKLTAPRLNAVQELDNILDPPDEPQAPRTGEVQRDKRGRVEKDAGGSPIVGRNYDDPSHVAALAAHKKLVDRLNRAKTVAMLLECLGDQVEVEAKVEDYQGGGAAKLAGYYDKVWDELEGAGIDLVAISKLTQAALRLCGLQDDEVTNARDALGADSGN